MGTLTIRHRSAARAISCQSEDFPADVLQKRLMEQAQPRALFLQHFLWYLKNNEKTVERKVVIRCQSALANENEMNDSV